MESVDRGAVNGLQLCPCFGMLRGGKGERSGGCALNNERGKEKEDRLRAELIEIIKRTMQERERG